MSTHDAKRLVLVVGVGRSGTSLLAGILGHLGLHIPQPEVNPDETNPRGFGEPRWVVDFHNRLLKARRVTVNDSRPAAWEATAAAADEAAHDELRDWLGRELDGHHAVVVKDPRTSWFLPLWTRCSRELGVPPRFVTMLRPPAETLMSARQSYGTWQSHASRAAAWVNIALETERMTRSDQRAFIRYEDLLADWRRELGRAGELLALPELSRPDPTRAASVDEFVDPSLHRNRVGWEELDVPSRMRDLAERVWTALQPLATPGGDAAPAHGELDAARRDFQALHAEAEAIAQSSIHAAKPRRKPPAPPPPPPPPSPPSLRARVMRQVPVRYRKRARRALGALRGARS
jgi:hypothetical protein